jgi:fumarate reductase subunit C
VGEAVNPEYQLYHPKWHRMRMPIFWWLGKLSYTKFITRELTSLAVGYAAIMIVIQVWALSRGSDAYEHFVGWLQSPVGLILNTLVVLALLFHTITWLNLAPKALIVRIGGRRVPEDVVLIAHYFGWFAASALVIWYLVGR